jgi:hypothetical protein
MKALTIIITLLFIVGGLMVVSTSNTHQLNIFSTSLNSDPTWSWNNGINGVGGFYFKFTLPQIQNTYNYNGYPCVITSMMPDASSTMFGESINVYSSSNPVTFTTSLYFHYQVILTNLTNNQNTTLSTGSTAYTIQTIQNGGNNGNLSIFNNLSIKGLYTGIITVFVSISVGVSYYNSIITNSGSTFQQAYAVSGSASLSETPSIQQDNGVIHFYGTTGFGQYYIIVKNGYGQTMQNISVPQYSNYNVSYSIPSNAFVHGGNNNWTATIYNTKVPLFLQVLFIVENIKMIPTTPKITITNTPTNGMWVVNDTVDVSITAQNSTDIIVYVYINSGGMPPVGSGNWIIYQKTYQLNNGQTSFSFQIPKADTITILVYAQNSAGESYPASYTITAQNINPTPFTTPSIGILYLLLFIIALIGGAIIIGLYVPVSILDRLIIIFGFVFFMAMVFVAYILPAYIGFFPFPGVS